MRRKIGTDTSMAESAAGVIDMVKKAPVSAVDAIIPMVNGSTNPAISLSAIISFLFFAKVAIIFLTLRGLTDNF